jgi:hypothetical protein
MHTVIFTGSRRYDDIMKVNEVFDYLMGRYGEELFIKVGDAPGLDALVRHVWGVEDIFWKRGKIFYADWERYGNGAGPIRNHEMVDSGADECIAFPDDESKGTKDCAEYFARQSGIPVWFPELPAWAQWAVPIATFKEG